MSRFALEVRELTPRGRGAVSVLSVRGPGALEVVASLVAGRALAPGRLVAVRFEAGDELVDEGLVHVASPEEVELHLHGAPPVVERMRGLLAERSLPRAARQTLEERAEELLAGAPSEAAARVLLDQAQGALRSALEALLAEPNGERLRAGLAALLAGERVARRLLEPPLVVLAGPVNAGKSTLFNLLVGSERAIVDAQAGTTRDALREGARLGAYAVVLVDTAGERGLLRSTPPEQVERAGQELARSIVRSADLVLWLRPPWDGADPPATPAALRVLASRADELGVDPGPGSISSRTAPERARAAVEDAFHEALDLPREPWRPGAPVLFEAALARHVRGLLEGAFDPRRARGELGGILGR